MKPTVTWILMMEHNKAKVFWHSGNDAVIYPLEGHEFFTEPKSEPADHPGRSFASASNRRHTYEQKDDLDIEVIKKAVDLLEEGVQNNKFDRFIVCAPPKLLGSMRSSMPKKLSDKLYGELPKSLINTPIEKLPAHFKKMLPV